MLYDLTVSERANKSALLLVNERYSTQLAPFVKNSKARLTYVQADLQRIIEAVCEETGADPEWVTERFSVIAPVLEKSPAKHEDLTNPDPNSPYATNLDPDSQVGREGILEADVTDRGEVPGAGLAESMTPGARVDLNDETADPKGETEVDYKTTNLKEAMTARDFVAIAGILAQNNADENLINSFADMLQGTNPLFDRDRFIAAAQGSPLSGRDAPRMMSCFRCGTDLAKTSSSTVCETCTQELTKLAVPAPPGTDGSNGIGAGAPAPGLQEEFAPPANPNVPYVCQLCGREGNREEILTHINREHADVLNKQQQDMSTENMGQDDLGVTGGKTADVPRNEDAAEVQPLPENPGDKFDDYVQKLAETAAARKFSQLTDEDIHSIASQVGQSPDDVKNSVKCVAVFGDQVAVNGQLGGDPAPPEGYEEISVQGLSGQQPSHDALVPTDLILTAVADQMNMSKDLAYNMVKDKYGADLPDKYHASVGGQVHYYLPTDMAGNQQQQQQNPQVGPTAPPAPVAQPQQQPQQPMQ